VKTYHVKILPLLLLYLLMLLLYINLRFLKGKDHRGKQDLKAAAQLLRAF
jgi:hypothetical protein